MEQITLTPDQKAAVSRVLGRVEGVIMEQIDNLENLLSHPYVEKGLDYRIKGLRESLQAFEIVRGSISEDG